MLSIQDFIGLQGEGVRDTSALLPSVYEALQDYVIWSGSELLKEAMKRGATVEEAVVNAFRYGIALGLRLKVENGELKGRE